MINSKERNETDRQGETDRQTHRQTHRHTDTDKETETEVLPRWDRLASSLCKPDVQSTLID